jgi:Holliday junction resolvase
VVGSSYSSYERELKAILEGDGPTLGRYRKLAGSKDALNTISELENHPFLVVRAAGSHGFDLVAMRNPFALPIEVKCSSQKVIHFTSSSGRNTEQYETLLKATSKAGLSLLYAYRLMGVRDGDPWRVFAASKGAEKGLSALLLKNVPKLDSTASGNIVLRWSEGLELMKFVARAIDLSVNP